MRYAARNNLRLMTAALLTTAAINKVTADPSPTNTPPPHLLLLDTLGRPVKLATNELHQSLLPSAGLDHQIPELRKGTRVPQDVLNRLHEARKDQSEFAWFPAAPPRLMPYLAGIDAYGNTALQQGALLPVLPPESWLQRAKYQLSESGLCYSLDQTLTFVNMTDVMQGDNTLGFYTFDFQAKWAIFDARDSAGTAGWISAEITAKTGLGTAGNNQSAQSNLGTVSNPTGIWQPQNGFQIPELAWQQALAGGEFVVLAGLVDQGNYLDQNAYAQNSPSQFLNSALMNSMVMPLPDSNFALDLQWQPEDHWYAMFGASIGGVSPGQLPWTDFSWKDWALLWEFGWSPQNVFGLGPGVYRIQPFLARAGGPTQGGLCFNLQQQLGKNSPLGWFGRFGFGGAQVTAGASAQAGTGFVLQAPLYHTGLVPRLKNDFLGVGFVWSQPSSTTATVYHENEYVFETVYALQLTPTIKLQPDFQIVWNPAYNPNASQAIIFQLQLDILW